jgi:predicted RNA-binding protein with TRAM domain
VLLATKNKVEILTWLYTTKRSNLEDTRSYGGGGFGRMGGERRFSGPRPFKPSPVRVGEEYDVRIESMSKRGDSGVARVQGLVIFIVGTKVGDTVKIRITKVGRGYATAEVIGQGTASESSEVPSATTTTTTTDDISNTGSESEEEQRIE